MNFKRGVWWGRGKGVGGGVVGGSRRHKLQAPIMPAEVWVMERMEPPGKREVQFKNGNKQLTNYRYATEKEVNMMVKREM